MNIEIKYLRHADNYPESTLFFEATDYIDGVRAGMVSDERSEDGYAFELYELREAIDAYGATLPLYESELTDSNNFKRKLKLRHDSTSIIYALVVAELARKRGLRLEAASRATKTKMGTTVWPGGGCAAFARSSARNGNLHHTNSDCCYKKLDNH